MLLTANSRDRRVFWGDLWVARELLFYLVWKDVVVRYKQAALGLAWAVLRPLLMAGIFTFVFGRIAQLPSGGIPYLLLVFSGIAPWLYFSGAVGECGNSLVANASLITKVYFPRLVIPVSVIIANAVDLVVTLLFLFVLLMWFKIPIKSTMLLVPVVFMILFLFVAGLGIWLAALNARYRDVSFVMPFLLSVGMYLSPVGFSSAAVPEGWHVLYGLNPMVGIIDGFRYALFGSDYPFKVWTLGYTAFVAISLIYSSVIYFRRIEREIIDTL
jgi:lipopolysaccharide transport system permease protein